MTTKPSSIVAVAGTIVCLALTLVGGSMHVEAADYYFDANNATAYGDGSGNFQQGANGRITTNASGTTATANWSNTNGVNKSLQFGFGTTDSGNNTNGGNPTVGSGGGANNPTMGSVIFNASGSSSYTITNASTTATNSITLNTGGADVAAGYGIVVNSNVVGDTTFRTNTGGGAFQIILGANQTWQNNSSSYALLMNVPVTGAFSLTTNGAGTIVFGGANTFSGGLTVSAGTLRATNASALGAGSVSVSSTATLNVLAAITKNIANSGTVSIGAGGNLSASSLGGVLSVGGASGTTATFTSTLGSGTLALASLAATGNTNVSLAAGTQINASGAVDFSGSSNLLTLTGPVAAPGNYTLIQGSSLSGTSTLALTGGAVGNASIAMGSSAVVGRNTYEFGSSATALLLNVTGTIYNLVWDNAVSSGTWNDTAAVWLQSGTGSPITFVNNDNTSFGTAATVAVPAAVATGAMVINNASGAINLSGAGSVAAYSLAKSGAGSATLGAAATISNGLTVSAGSLDVTGTTTVSAAGVTVSGGSFVSSGQTNISAGGFAVSGGAAALNGSGTISGGITLTGGSLTIEAAQTINGDTSVSGGAALVLNSGTLGAGTLTLNNGSLTAGNGVSALSNAVAVGASGGTITTDNTLTLNGAVTGAGNTLTKLGVGTLTLNGGLGTSGNGMVFNVSSGTVVMAGNNNKTLNGGTITGNVSLTAGSFLLGGNVTGSGTVAASNGTTIRPDLNAGGLSKTLATPVSIDGAVALQSYSSGSRFLILSGPLSGSGTATSSGSGKVSLTGAGSTFTGGLIVSHTSSGGYTEVTSQALGNAATVVVNNNVNRTGAQLNFANSTTGTFAGVISGAGIVGIGGVAKVVLAGANTYSAGTQLDGDVGITTVSDGTSGSLGTGTITSISSAGRIFLETGTSITFSQAVNTGAASTSVLAFAGTGKSFLLTGSVAGSGQLKASSGAILDLSSQNGTTNTNTGGIEIGNAFVRAAVDANLGSGAINFSGTDSNSGWIAATTGTISKAFTIGGTGTNANIKAVFDTSGNNLTLTGGINDKAGTSLGQLVKKGEGTLTLSASNGYTGTTTVASGTLVAGDLNAFGKGNMLVSGGVLDLNSLAVANAINLNGGSLANAASYGGTQTLNSVVSYASGTVGGTVNVASGGTLKGSGVAFSGPVTIGDGGIHAPGNSPGSQTFASGLSYSGSSTLQWELIANTDSLGAAGTSYDSISVTGGSLTIADGALLQMVFNGAGSTVNWNDDFWNTNHSWTVIGLSGSATGSGLFGLLGDNTTWLDSSSSSLASAMVANNRTTSTFNVANVGNTAGSVVLNYTAVVVPEPSAVMLLGLGAGGLIVARRRKRS